MEVEELDVAVNQQRGNNSELLPSQRPPLNLHGTEGEKMTRQSLNFHPHLRHKAFCLCVCVCVCEKGDNSQAFPSKECVCNREGPQSHL